MGTRVQSQTNMVSVEKKKKEKKEKKNMVSVQKPPLHLMPFLYLQ